MDYEEQLSAAKFRAERDIARQEVKELREGLEAMRPRLMPEGYEWPRYESGEPLRYEDRYVYDGREREVWHVDFDSYGEPTILNKDGTRSHPDKGERVKRPAVIAADGEPLEESAEVFGAWQKCSLIPLIAFDPELWKIIPAVRFQRHKLLDECADVIQATCNLIASLGVEDFRPYMKECEQRNRERGRITDGWSE